MAPTTPPIVDQDPQNNPFIQVAGNGTRQAPYVIIERDEYLRLTARMAQRNSPVSPLAKYSKKSHNGLGTADDPIVIDE